LVSDAIRRIKDKETEADELVRRASGDSKRRVAEAHEKAVGVVDEMRAEARRGEQLLLATARSEAEAVAEGIAAESTTSVRGTRENAESKISDGVAKVLESLVSG
jgi:vacuolar-type H+-ATPase subunit H